MNPPRKIEQAGTASLRTLRPIVVWLQRVGVDVDAMLAECGLTTERVFDPSARSSHGAYERVFRLAEARTGDPLYALRVVATVLDFTPLTGFSFVSEFVPAQLFAASATLGEGLERYSRFYGLVHDAARFSLERREHEVAVRFSLPKAPSAPASMLDYHVALALKLVRDVSAQPVPLRRVLFDHPAHAAPAAYEALLGVPVGFDAGENAIVFAARDLGIALRNFGPALLPLVERKALADLGGAEPCASLASQVSGLLADALGRRPVTARASARALGLSERTLARRLGDEGTSYQKILDETRSRLARRYVMQDGLSAGEVAALLGYSEPRAFQRAFRRWFGQSPGEFRGRDVPTGT